MNGCTDMKDAFGNEKQAMWYLVNKKTGKPICYSSRKSDLTVLIENKHYEKEWELVWK